MYTDIYEYRIPHLVWRNRPIYSTEYLELLLSQKVWKTEPSLEDLKNRELVFPTVPLNAKLPEIVDLRGYLLHPRDQGFDGACAAFSGCVAMEYQNFVQRGESQYLSAEFLFSMRENQSNPGMRARDLMSIMKEKGTVLEKTLPYGTRGTVITLEMQRQALRNKIQDYARVTTIQGAKHALITNGPLILSLPVFDNKVEDFWRPKPYARWYGHAISAVGYTPDGFIIQNSWGKGYGVDGYSLFPFTDFTQLWDIFTIVTIS